jgi:hypothetical protein
MTESHALWLAMIHTEVVRRAQEGIRTCQQSW